MTKFYPLFIFLTLPAAASAQSESPDSVSTTALEEIIIEAPKVVRKADMDVYHPSKSAVDNSKNGLQLLNNLMIPTLTVSDALGSLSAAGQSVQVRINGREASIDQVKALLPETIRRVEWIDNPGLRYGGAQYVVNFVVANPTLGGSLMLQAKPALNMAWGYYQGDVKLNNGRSQWDIGGYFKLTEHVKAHRDYHETFTYPDGRSLTRTETPVDGWFDNSQGAAWVSYSYIKPDTTTFYASIAADKSFHNQEKYRGLLTLSDGSPDIDLTNAQGRDGTTPKFNAYLEHNIGRQQTLVVDFSASMYLGHTFSDYLEQLTDGNILTDVSTYIKDRNQAYGVEADYIKRWKNGRLTAGAQYNANRNRSEYRNLGGEVFHQRQDKVYMFAEYFHRLNRFTLTAGMGAQYTSYLFRETDQGRDGWHLRPQATVTYSPAQSHQLRLAFTSWQTAPSLSETNITAQQIDGFQWTVGNPDLKTSTSYMLTLQYSFQLPRTYASFGVRAFTSPDAIAPYMAWQGDRLVTTYENASLQNLSIWLAPQIEVVPDWLTIAGMVQYRAERMKGTGYKLYNHDWSGNVGMELTHWGFTLEMQYNRAQRNLWGEGISWGESFSVVQLSYNWREWQFAAGMLMPFGEYDQGSKSLSRWNTNETHMRMNMRMPYISLNYNLQWGRQKRGARRLIDSGANADQSSAAGR